MIEMDIPAEFRGPLNRVVTAGLKVITENGLEEDMEAAENKPQALAQAIISLLGLLMQEAKGKIPSELIIPALVQLMYHANDYLKTSGIGELPDDDLAEATGIAVDLILEATGLNKPQPGGQPAAPGTQPPAAPAGGMPPTGGLMMGGAK